MLQKIILVFLIIFSLSSCSKEKDLGYKPQDKVDPFQIYREGYEAFERGDYFFAQKKFLEARSIVTKLLLNDSTNQERKYSQIQKI